MDLEATVLDCLNYRILMLGGELDVTTGPTLRSRIFELLSEGGSPLFVDMTGVVFCDSTGLNIAVAAKKHATSLGCSLAFVGPHRSCMQGLPHHRR